MPEHDDPLLLAEQVNALPRPWLIGVDVDGTLAPIVSRPEDSALEPLAREALAALADRVGVMVAVVSGRPLHDLRHKFELPEHVMLLGSHGAEAGSEIDARSDDEELLLQATIDTMLGVADDLDGAWIEHKPLAVALHVRQADPTRALQALADIEPVLQGLGAITLHRGKMVLEAAVRPTSKKTAFGRLRERLEPATTLFIGDDGSDEHVFQSLADHDIAIKVGPGPTAAAHRLALPRDVVQFLTMLAANR